MPDKNQKDGFALASVLGVLTVLTILGISYLGVSNLFFPATLGQSNRLKALHAVESAIYWDAFNILRPPIMDSARINNDPWLKPQFPPQLPVNIQRDTLVPWVRWVAKTSLEGQSVQIKAIAGKKTPRELVEYALILLGPPPAQGLGGWITGSTRSQDISSSGFLQLFPPRLANFANATNSWLHQNLRRTLFPPPDSAGNSLQKPEHEEFRKRGNTSIGVSEFSSLTSKIWAVQNGDLRIYQAGLQSGHLQGPRTIAVEGDCWLEGQWTLEEITLLCSGNLNIKGSIQGNNLLIYSGESIIIDGEHKLQGWFFSDGPIHLQGIVHLQDHSGLVSTSLRNNLPGSPTLRLEGRGSSRGWLLSVPPPGSLANVNAVRIPQARADFSPGSLYIGRDFRHYGITYSNVLVLDGYVGGSAWTHRLSCAATPQESCPLSGTINNDSLPLPLVAPVMLDLGSAIAWSYIQWKIQ